MQAYTLQAGAMNIFSRFLSLNVVIYGTHSADWMEALGENAEVWKRMPAIRKVMGAKSASALQLANLYAPRTVILPLMEDHIESCPTFYPALIPSADDVALLRDKSSFDRYAKSHHLSHHVPQTYPDITQSVFPCVIKRLDLNNNNGVALLESHEDFLRCMESGPWKNQKYILQELITGGIEYFTYCIFDQGELLWHCSFCDESPGDTLRNPCVFRRRCTATESTIRQIQEFMKPLNYTGPCNVDYQLDADKYIKIFEINPRLGGSLMKPQFVGDLESALNCIIKRALLNSGNRLNRYYANRYFSYAAAE